MDNSVSCRANHSVRAPVTLLLLDMHNANNDMLYIQRKREYRCAEGPIR
jgi:hypothetical protein